MPLCQRSPGFVSLSTQQARTDLVQARDCHCQGKADHLQLNHDEKVQVPALSKNEQLSMRMKALLFTVQSSASIGSHKQPEARALPLAKVWLNLLTVPNLPQKHAILLATVLHRGLPVDYLDSLDGNEEAIQRSEPHAGAPRKQGRHKFH